jgi:hypothetical protein
MSDDFFCINDFTWEDLKVPKHNNKRIDAFGTNKKYWNYSKMKTNQFLIKNHISTVDYTTHCFAVYEMDKLEKIIDEYDLTTPCNDYTFEDIYGNLYWTNSVDVNNYRTRFRKNQHVHIGMVEEAKKQGKDIPDFQPDFAGKEYLLQRQLKTEARGDIIQRLRDAGIRPTAMMDISDGLSSELRHICKQSHVGCRIFEKQIPIDYQTAVMAEELNMNVTTCALNGGEDYELLFTVPIGDHEKIQQLDDIRLIGHITQQSLGHVLVTRDDQEFPLKAQGWNPL